MTVHAVPIGRDPSQSDGVAAGLHDPLWLLGRQVQFGESTASLLGSPIAVEHAVQALPLTTAAGDPRTTPIEALAEHEPVDPASVAERVASGRLLGRLLDDVGAPGARVALLERHPLTVAAVPDSGDPAGDRRARLLVGRVIDGHAVREAMGPDAATAPVSYPADEEIAARAVLSGWADRQDERAGIGLSGWVADRLEHELPVAAGGVELDLSYPGGDVEWSDLDVRARVDLPAAPAPLTATPVQVTFPGMPASEVFAFEEGRVNLAALAGGTVTAPEGADPTPTGLAGSLLLWFGLLYGDDWYLLPVDLPAGSLATVRSMTVWDTFGRATRVPHVSEVDGPASPWRMFAPTGADDLLVVPPARGGVQDGSPVEEVLVAHDEVANLGWVIERLVPGTLGAPRDRREEPRRPTPEPTGPGQVHAYRLGTPPPQHWLPLVPDDADPLLLRVGSLPAGAGTSRPRGQLLSGEHVRLRREEVSRQGQQIVRRARRARGSDGRTRVWFGRLATSGAGEANSGLAFDLLDRT